MYAKTCEQLASRPKDKPEPSPCVSRKPDNISEPPSERPSGPLNEELRLLELRQHRLLRERKLCRVRPCARFRTATHVDDRARGRGVEPSLFRHIIGRACTELLRELRLSASATGWRRTDGTYCRACSLNRTIPNLSEFGSLRAWHELRAGQEAARLLAAALRPAVRHRRSRQGRLTFDFARNVMTGHLDGVITIDVMEADAVERERQRQHFDEPYRSLLGHLRHESGHFYWTLLVEPTGPDSDEFRALFGDERRTTAPRSPATTRGPPRLAHTPRLGLCQFASMGGLGRDLGALPAYGRCARHGGSHRHGAARRGLCVTARSGRSRPTTSIAPKRSWP